MKRTLSLVVLALAVSTIACSKSNFIYNPGGGANVMTEKRTHYLFGLSGPNKPLRADQLCPSGVAKVTTKASFGDMCLSGCTLNIYTPRTVEITCNSGRAHNFYLDENDQVVGHESPDQIAPLPAQPEKKSASKSVTR